MDDLENELRSQGLIAGLLSSGKPQSFYVGDRFLNLLMFLGCSPQIGLDPEADGEDACFVQFRLEDAVSFISAEKPPAVRCPGCRAPIEIVSSEFDSQFLCARCSLRSQLSDLDWRQAAAYASFFIQVHGIYPHEAVPAYALLDRLREYSAGIEWKYIYI